MVTSNARKGCAIVLGLVAVFCLLAGLMSKNFQALGLVTLSIALAVIAAIVGAED